MTNKIENELISVIMSTYNESEIEIKQSVDSILQQTYEHIELIIINDNPENIRLKRQLKDFANADNRVKVLENDKNRGLVYSLNRGISEATGNYIARMDADDISFAERLKEQKEYQNRNGFDIIGCFIQLIDDDGITVKPEMRFPYREKDVRRYIKYGNCLAHPSWFVKKCVFDDLKGYRLALHCEDYDFLLRAIDKGYIIGNIPQVLLKYRIRKQGISRLNRARQYVLRCYLSSNIENINTLSEKDISSYLESEDFMQRTTRLEEYYDKKQMLHSTSIGSKVKAICSMVTNKWLYDDLYEKMQLYLREHLK